MVKFCWWASEKKSSRWWSRRDKKATKFSFKCLSCICKLLVGEASERSLLDFSSLFFRPSSLVRCGNFVQVRALSELLKVKLMVEDEKMLRSGRTRRWLKQGREWENVSFPVSNIFEFSTRKFWVSFIPYQLIEQIKSIKQPKRLESVHLIIPSVVLNLYQQHCQPCPTILIPASLSLPASD